MSKQKLYNNTYKWEETVMLQMREDRRHRTAEDNSWEELTVYVPGLSKQKINIICLSNKTELQVFTVIQIPKSF